MAYMTDEEADILDEELTLTIPELGPNGEGFFSEKGYQMIALDKSTARRLVHWVLRRHIKVKR